MQKVYYQYLEKEVKVTIACCLAVTVGYFTALGGKRKRV